MFDKDTWIIGYDERRGEPRGKHKKGDSWEGRGHCIDCTACVQVCPTGIDIRDGLQMECIACGLCVDACDDIMEKIGLPKGLVRYDTENKARQRADDISKKHRKWRLLRPRTYYYIFILIWVLGLMIYAQLNRPLIDLTVLHDRNPLFVKLSNGDIRNGYEIKILNKTHEHRHYKLSVEGIENPEISIKAAGDITQDDIYVEAGTVGHFKTFVSTTVIDKRPREIRFILEDHGSHAHDIYKTMFISQKPNRN